MTGVLYIRTTKEFGESTVSKILDLVENASSRKSRSENFISKFAKYYTPLVCYAALALAILPPLFRTLVFGLSAELGEWIYRALTFLVISCPCALVISIPLSFFAGIGGAGNAGILIKGSNYLEALSKTGTVVFDKTGTLTHGVFEVTEIHCVNSSDQLLEYAAYAESASSHPIAKSIQRAYGKSIDRSRVTDVKELGGNGVVALVDGVEVAVGSERLMQRMQIECNKAWTHGSVVHVARNGKYAGYLVLSDQIKESSKTALGALKGSIGVKNTVLLSGDHQSVAEEVARNLGIDTAYGDLLPDGKVTKLEELLEGKGRNETLVFVGDGINDAPVLSRADIGIAMGAMGSDAAIEAADIVLMDDDPMKIPKAIRISKKCMSIVYQNIGFAIGVKALCLILGALGYANMWLAIFADVGVMVLAVLNAIRALFVKKL